MWNYSVWIWNSDLSCIKALQNYSLGMKEPKSLYKDLFIVTSVNCRENRSDFQKLLSI